MSRSIFSRPVLLAEIIFASVLIIFSPCLKANLTNWDDQVHIYLHPLVAELTWSNAGKMFFDSVNGVYIPLTTLTFGIEKHFFGYDPGVVHLNNMLLHALVAVFVMLLGVAMGLAYRGAFLGALLFALHPIHVESVAWATERKDVLYSVFYLASLLLWWRWLNGRKGWDLGFVFLAATLSLLAKPMAVSLPLVMALLAWYRTGYRDIPWARVGLFAALSAVVGSVTYISCARNPVANSSEAPLIWVWTAIFPLWKFFWPVTLHPIYDLPEPILFWHLPFVLSFICVGALIWWLWRNRSDRLLLLAIGWYVFSTFFLYRFDAKDPHIVADRFMYLPSAGLCLWLGRQASRWLDGPRRRLAATVIAVLFVVLSVKTYCQCRIWSDGETLWTYVISQNHRRELAYNNRAVIYVAQNRFDLAFRDITQAIWMTGDRPRVFYNRGVILNLWAERLKREGKGSEAEALYLRALADFSEAIVADPYNTKAYQYRGLVKHQLGDQSGALSDIKRAQALGGVAFEGILSDFFSQTHVP